MDLTPNQLAVLDQLQQVRSRLKNSGKAAYILGKADVTAIVHSLRARGFIVRGPDGSKLERSKLPVL